MSKQTIRLGPVEEWDIDKLSAIADNAKLHPDWQVEQIAESMDEFTFIDPMGLDENGEILEGRGRFLAAKKRGYKTVPAFQVFGLTEAQKVAYRLAHNKLTMTTGFDPEILKLNFEFLQEEGFDLDLTGFSDLELSFLDEEEEEKEQETQEYNPESSAKEVNVDEFEFEHECPKCGFGFNSKK